MQIPGIPTNTRIAMEGSEFLERLPDECAAAAFFDPQYRGILDKMKYGNEGKGRGADRANLPQMTEDVIAGFICQIARVIKPSGHLFLWMDKFHLCSDFQNWHGGTPLSVVDMVTWDKGKIGLGYRTRRKSEFCVILQKDPKRAKGVWTIRNIPDVWTEKIAEKTHPHNKPVMLQAELIEAVTEPNDLVIDPAAGSFSVMESCAMKGRVFMGVDVNETV